MADSEGWVWTVRGWGGGVGGGDGGRKGVNRDKGPRRDFFFPHS